MTEYQRQTANYLMSMAEKDAEIENIKKSHPPRRKNIAGLFWEIYCWLDGNHYPWRMPRIVGDRWITRLRCRCGLLDETVDGLIATHPRSL